MIPRSGGQYVFSRYALGEYAGFIVGWSDWISSCGSTAAVALLIGTFSAALVPALAGKAVAIAAGVAILFALLQWRGIIWGSNIQNFTSLIKALAFLALIAAGSSSAVVARSQLLKLSLLPPSRSPPLFFLCKLRSTPTTVGRA